MVLPHLPEAKLEHDLPAANIVSAPITALTLERQVQVIMDWAEKQSSRFVCVANVHMLMEAYWHENFRQVLHAADLVTPDGMPLVWMLRLLNFPEQDRVCGMDLLVKVCSKAEERNTSVFFLGSTTDVLNQMRMRIKKDFPALQVAGIESLPFRPLTSSEDEELVEKINETSAGIVFVALGCPKQEIWMMQHKHKINAVMVGIGGAFPVYAGVHKRAPQWIRDMGFEWLYRLLQEPRRLYKRYVKTIPPFLFLAFKQLLARQPEKVRGV